MMELPENKSDSPDSPLTRIRVTYTLSSTPDNDAEIDQVTINKFLRVLAEVAINIASRRSKNDQSASQ
jgi:hypothetical protein